MFTSDSFPTYLYPIGSWNMQVTRTAYTLKAALIAQLINWIEEWAALPMHTEPTWVQQTHGVPALFVRFDLHPNGQPFELEVRPQGMGTTGDINPMFAESLASIRETWPNFDSVQTPDHAAAGCDDHLWLERHPLGTEPSEGLVLVRNMVRESSANHLADRAIAPVANEGDKAYGQHFGWWRKIHAGEALPWDTSFVLKPLYGAKSRGIAIWINVPGKQRPNGAYTRTKVENTLRDQGSMWLQEYYEPAVVHTEQGDRNLMLRPFFGFNTQTRTWHYLGGEYVLGDTVRIHGTPASIFGPLV